MAFVQSFREEIQRNSEISSCSAVDKIKRYAYGNCDWIVAHSLWDLPSFAFLADLAFFFCLLFGCLLDRHLEIKRGRILLCFFLKRITISDGRISIPSAVIEDPTMTYNPFFLMLGEQRRQAMRRLKSMTSSGREPILKGLIIFTCVMLLDRSDFTSSICTTVTENRI